MILCIPNNRAYIGQSKNIKRRWNEHYSMLKHNKHTNAHLQNCYNKYGKTSLFFTILESCTKDLSAREKYYLNTLDEELRLNLCLVEETNYNRSPKPFKSRKPLSDEHKQKLSEAMTIALTGRKLSEETKKKMSESKRKMSEETRQKMSRAKKKMWDKKKSHEEPTRDSIEGTNLTHLNLDENGSFVKRISATIAAL